MDPLLYMFILKMIKILSKKINPLCQKNNVKEVVREEREYD